MQRSIGRYQVLEEIASGGQGTVYRAWDTSSGRVVALKVLHPHLSSDAGVLERFRREAQLAAAVSHPNITQIFEVGQDGNLHFIAMEFLPLSIHNLMESQGRLPVERAADICHQAALALQAASSRGIIHRDIKPQNLLLAPDGSVKVTDFGIARATALSTMTRTGALMGTPHYMSPEQAQGQRVDVRSDIYSLGIVLYQMLSGQLPFEADTPFEVMRQHIEERPTPVRRLRSQVPAALDRIVQRCLEKSPERRYPTPRDLALALREAAPGIGYARGQQQRPAQRPAAPPAQRAAPPRSPQPRPVRPGTTWMESWARAWQRVHRSGWARMVTVLSVVAALVAISVNLGLMDRIGNSLNPTSEPQAAVPPAIPGRPAPTAVSGSLQPLVQVSDDFEGSLNRDQWALLGSAEHDLEGGAVLLTPAEPEQIGWLFHQEPIMIERFEAVFKFEIGGGTGGDGMAFVVSQQNPYSANLLQKNPGLGTGVLDGGFVIEFDTVQNPEPVDPHDNHVGFTPLIPSLLRSEATATVPRLRNNGVFEAYVVFDAGVVRVYLSNPGIAMVPTLVLEHAIDDLVPFEAYIGFVGDTGGRHDRHVLHEVSFTAFNSAPRIPEDVHVAVVPASPAPTVPTTAPIAPDGAALVSRYYATAASADFTEPLSNNWLLRGAAYQDDTQGVILTETANNETGFLFLKHPLVTESFAVEFSFSIRDGTGADGLAFVVSRSFPALDFVQGHRSSSFDQLDGFAVEFDTNYNPEHDTSGSNNHVGITLYPEMSSLAEEQSVPPLRNSGVFEAFVIFDNGHVQLFLKNDTINLEWTLFLDHTIPDFQPFEGYFGFAAFTGGRNDRHTIHRVHLRLPDSILVAAALAPTPTWVPMATPTPAPHVPVPDRHGNALNLAIAEDPFAHGFLPFENVSSAQREVNSLIFSRPFRQSPSGIAPDLGEAWEVSEDFTTWTVRIRQDALFHDGSPVTAHDVSYSIMVFQEIQASQGFEDLQKEGLSWTSWIQDGGVSIIDYYTLEIGFSEPFPNFHEVMAQPTFIIVPDRMWFDEGLHGRAAEDVTKLVGSGPFQPVEYQPGAKLVLERNPHYYEPNLPHVDRITIHVVPERATRMAAFVTGQIDFLGIPNGDPQGSISRDELEHIVQKVPDNVLVPPSSAPALMFDTQTIPFADMKVRRAIAYAIDQDTLNEALLEGRGERQGPVPKALFAEWTTPLDDPDARFRGYHYDPEKARELLVEAGYTDGFETQLTVSARWVEWGSVVAEMLAEVGIATGMGISPSEHMAGIGEFGPQGIPHQGMVLAPFQRFDGDIELFIRKHFTSQGTHNYSRWTEGLPEDVMAEFAQSLDPEQRRELVSILINHLAEEVVVVPLPAPPAVYARSGRVQGSLELTDLGTILKQVWIGEAAQTGQPTVPSPNTTQAQPATLAARPQPTPTAIPVAPVAVEPTATDRTALVALYNATDGPNWKNDTNWLSDASIGEWHGVTTNNSGRVTQLVLTGNQLSGEIPPELGGLTNLERLSLMNNCCGLSGRIPAELGSLTNLRSLNLAGNLLSGTIPPELGNLSNLEELWLSANQLSGLLPQSLTSLSVMKSLRFGHNPGLCAPIDTALQEWLQRIPNTSDNSCAPVASDSRDRPTLLALHHAMGGANWKDNTNWLSDAPIGGWYGVTTNGRGRVIELILPGNQLSGRTPSELGSLTDLEVLNLSNNELTGEIPPELGSLTNLRSLSLYHTELSGEIPPGLASLTNLEGLYLNHTQLSGEIPSWLGGLTNLTTLQLLDTGLTGKIPPELGSLTNLISLDLRSNDLSGEIPPELCSLTNLQRLSLNSNELSGKIPPELGSLTNLRNLGLRTNQLSGELPFWLGRLINLEVLLLSGNQLSGEIPSEVSRLTNLRALLLSRNHLTGCVPDSLRDVRENDYPQLGLPFCGGAMLTTTASPAEGGTVAPAGTNTYQHGARVTLIPTPASGYRFQGWEGACSGSGECVLVMDGNKSVTANFLSPAAIFLLSGLVNDQPLDVPTVSVTPGGAISGVVSILVENAHDPTSVFPVGATPSWVDHEGGYWSIDSWAPGRSETRYAVQLDLKAPTSPGTYAIIFAASPETTLAHVMSATHWASASPRWNNGDDIASWDSSQIEFAIANGYVNAPMYGFEPMRRFGAAAIIVVVTPSQ